GAWRTFLFSDQVNYNSSIWTMYYEFWGSFLVFVIAPFIFFLLDRSIMLAGLALVTIATGAWQHNPLFLAFPAGMAIYVLLAVKYRPGITIRLVLVAAAILLLGYGGNAVGFYRPFGILDFPGVPPFL